jgi:hypothetical protein
VYHHRRILLDLCTNSPLNHCLFFILLPLSFLAAAGAAVVVDADSDLVMAVASATARPRSPRVRCISDLWSADDGSGFSSLVLAAFSDMASTEPRSGATAAVAPWLAPAPPMVLSCSTKSSCTMVRSGIRSLDIASARTSGDSFRQSISRHRRFLSALLSSGCSCMHACAPTMISVQLVHFYGFDSHRPKQSRLGMNAGFDSDPEISVDGVVEAVVIAAGNVRQTLGEFDELADGEIGVESDGAEVLVEDPGHLLHGGAHPPPLVGRRRRALELCQEVLEHGLRRADVVRLRVGRQRDQQVRRPRLVELRPGLPHQLRARGRRRAHVVGHAQQPEQEPTGDGSRITGDHRDDGLQHAPLLRQRLLARRALRLVVEDAVVRMNIVAAGGSQRVDEVLARVDVERLADERRREQPRRAHGGDDGPEHLDVELRYVLRPPVLGD